MDGQRIAVITAVYPGVEPYLPAWYNSICSQSYQSFDLWVGVDGLNIGAIGAWRQPIAPIHWVMADRGDSPAAIRQKVIEPVIASYWAVVFVDADDVLYPSRIEAAIEGLEHRDLTGCAMDLIDEAGRDLGSKFALGEGQEAATILSRYNVFGLSNTAYRCTLLSRCLPIPQACVLVDWYLATRAWALGARMTFDPICRMAYRQHDNNTARVLPPFTPRQIAAASRIVLHHYDIVLAGVPELNQRQREELEAARWWVRSFQRVTTTSPQILKQYVQALNQLPAQHLWWTCVAHPALENIWRR